MMNIHHNGQKYDMKSSQCFDYFSGLVLLKVLLDSLMYWIMCLNDIHSNIHWHAFEFNRKWSTETRKSESHFDCSCCYCCVIVADWRILGSRSNMLDILEGASTWNQLGLLCIKKPALIWNTVQIKWTAIVIVMLRKWMDSLQVDRGPNDGAYSKINRHLDQQWEYQQCSTYSIYRHFICFSP